MKAEYQTKVEREFMEEERDPFDYWLAETLHRTVEEMRHTISNREYLEWRAYVIWRNAKEEMERKELHAR